MPMPVWQAVEALPWGAGLRVLLGRWRKVRRFSI